MALRKHIQMNKGRLSMTVFQAMDTGKVFLSIDKEFASRRIKGPLFTENELSDLAWLIEDYTRWESKGVPRHTTAQNKARDQVGDDILQTDSIGIAEIRHAIKTARKTKLPAERPAQAPVSPTRTPSRITLLPSMHPYTYKHTCKKCGSHNPAHLPGGSVERVKVCPECLNTYEGRGLVQAPPKQGEQSWVEAEIT